MWTSTAALCTICWASPMELYTPLFAVARVMGWSAHRIEELLSANKIIRPAYKSLGGTHEYIRRNERE